MGCWQSETGNGNENENDANDANENEREGKPRHKVLPFTHNSSYSLSSSFPGDDIQASSL